MTVKGQQSTKADTKGFVRSLYAKGRTPSECFGITRQELSDLEKRLDGFTPHGDFSKLFGVSKEQAVAIPTKQSSSNPNRNDINVYRESNCSFKYGMKLE